MPVVAEVSFRVVLCNFKIFLHKKKYYVICNCSYIMYKQSNSCKILSFLYRVCSKILCIFWNNFFNFITTLRISFKQVDNWSGGYILILNIKLINSGIFFHFFPIFSWTQRDFFLGSIYMTVVELRKLQILRWKSKNNK